MPRPADPRKQQVWLQHLQRWQASGWSVRDYCDRYQLGQASFYAWKRVLRQRGLLSNTSSASLRPPHDAAPTPNPLFVPVVVHPADGTAAPIELVAPDGWIVRVAAGCDAPTLRQVLALLREQSC